MYRGFQLDIIAPAFEDYREAGEQLFSDFSNRVIPTLKRFALTGGVLDAEKIQKNWFPDVKAQVFISHSHKDRDLAVCLAGWLSQELGLSVFIDSCIWGYAGDLQQALDNRECFNEDKKTYNYSKRNQSTAHVHMILNNALSMMIDATECLFFLKTPSSTIPSMIKEKTNSAWIFSELSLAQIIRKREPKRDILTKSLKLFTEGGKLLKEDMVLYPLPTEGLTPLSEVDLLLWKFGWIMENDKDSAVSLDELYKSHPLS